MMNELLLSVAIPILVAAVGISAVVLAIKAFKEKEKNAFSMKMLWIAYLYIMSLVSLMLFLYGGTKFTKAMLANAVAPYFSYSTNEYVRPNPIDVKGESVPEQYDISNDKDQKAIEFEGKTYYYSYAEYKSDIIDGVTFFVALAIMFAIHRLLAVKADDEKDSFLKKVYNFVGLAQYGVLSVVALPTAIYDLIKYFIEPLNLASYSRPIPGASIALLIFVLPTWIVFLMKMVKENKKK